MGKPEANVEKYLVKKCVKEGWMCDKITSYSRNGYPDRLIIGNGYVVFVETKAPDGTLRKEQVYCILDMEDRGADVRVCYTREQCDRLINEIKTGKFKRNKTCIKKERDEREARKKTNAKRTKSKRV